MTAAFWLFLWFLGQQQNASGTIQGTVVRAGTTQPLSGEMVALWPTTRTTFAAVDGRFSFRGVPPGNYMLTVVRDGVKLQLPVNYTGTQPTSVLLEVKPAPAITGTVFFPSGERAAAVRVQAFATVYTPLGTRPRSVMSVATDDLGDFRLFWLRHGEYRISASYSERDQRVALPGLRITPNLSKTDEGLPTLYYSNEYALSQSQKVRLNRDTDTTGMQLFLKDGPRYTISLTLVPEGTCARVAVVAEGAIVSSTDFVNNVCGSAKLTGLSQGTYFILAANEALASEVVRVTTVNVDTEAKVVLQPTATIFGRVTGNIPGPGRGGPRGGLGNTGVPGLGLRGAPPGSPAETMVRLSRSLPEISQDFEAPIAADGTFTIPGLGPGSYDVSVQRIPGNVYVRSITYGRFDSLFTPIEINNGTPAGQLSIDLAQSNATAAGAVVDRLGRPVPGAEVVLVPKGNRRRADRYRSATADAGGNFRITGIPNGMDYSVLAFEDIEPQSYFVFAYDDAAYSRYTLAAPTLPALASNLEFRLIAIPAEETAGGIH